MKKSKHTPNATKRQSTDSFLSAVNAAINPPHTPGPAQLPTGFEKVSPDEHEGVPLFSDGNPFNAIAFIVPRPECHSNARLLAASYNAFDSAARTLDCNAVELAESVQDGGICDLVAALKLAEHAMSFVLQPGYTQTAEGIKAWADELFLPAARAALAKVKGDGT